MSVSRLWRDRGKAQQAREVLAPVYGWFTEGLDTSDLKEAKALLDALSSPPDAPQYPAVDIKHLIDRLHTKGALRFLDLETTGPVELMPGVICEAASGHTESSMNIIVKTAEGDANICGDVIYDFNDQIVEPFHEIGDMEPRVTGNHGTTKRQEGSD